TIIGFLSGVVTTYDKVLVTWKTTFIAIVSVAVIVAIIQLASWIGATFLAGVPDWTWLVLQAAIVLAVLWRFAKYIPVALSFLAQVYILVIRGTPIVVQVMFIYFALPLISGWRIDALLAAI